jgi:hypothetical protein
MAAVSIPPQRLAVTTHHRDPTLLLYDIALTSTVVPPLIPIWRRTCEVRAADILANMWTNARCADGSLFAGHLGKDSGPFLPHVLRNIAKKSGSGNIQRGAGAVPWFVTSSCYLGNAWEGYFVGVCLMFNRSYCFGVTPMNRNGWFCAYYRFFLPNWDPCQRFRFSVLLPLFVPHRILFSLGLWLRWDNYFLGREEFLIGYSVRFCSGAGFHSVLSPSLDAFHIQNTVYVWCPCGKESYNRNPCSFFRWYSRQSYLSLHSLLDSRYDRWKMAIRLITGS